MRYAFEGFELDADRFELQQADGQVVQLRRQALDVLLYLVCRTDRVVTKQELVDAIWAGATVSETALPQAIVAIRRALGEGNDGSRLLQTVRGRGYRFVVPVHERAAGSGAAKLAEPMVGRDDAMASLQALLTEAVAGRGGVALLSGDAGAGRTRVALELVAAARDSGVEALMVRCDREVQASELWPWVQVVRSVLAAGPRSDDDRAPMGADIDRLDAIVELLREASRRRPLLVAIDDVDDADVASLLLLRLAARSVRDARVLLLVTYRTASVATSSPLARTLGALTRDDPRRQVTLAPLSRQDVALLAQAVLEAPPGPDVVARLFDKTGGNVLLLTQVLHSMRGPGGSPHASTSTLLAVDEMKEAIALNLTALPAGCRSIVDSASVLGSTFTLPVLAAMMQLDPAEALERMEEAVRVRLLARDPAATGAFRFQHVLERDVVYARLAPSRRVALHDRAAQALEGRGELAQAQAHRQRVRVLLGTDR